MSISSRSAYRTIVAITAGVAAGLFATLAATSDSAVRGTHQSFTWATPDGKPAGEALLFTELLPTGMNSRFLIEIAGGSRAVLSETIDAQAGTITSRFLHVPTNWWITVTTDLGIEATDYKDFFNKAYDALEASGATIEVSLKSSDGLEHQEVLPVRNASLSETLKEFGREIHNELAGSQLRKTMLPDRIAMLQFLDRGFPLGQIGEGFRTIAEFLSLFADPALMQKSPETQLVREEGDLQKGLVVTEPHLSSFVARFPLIALDEQP